MLGNERKKGGACLPAILLEGHDRDYEIPPSDDGTDCCTVCLNVGVIHDVDEGMLNGPNA